MHLPDTRTARHFAQFAAVAVLGLTVWDQWFWVGTLNWSDYRPPTMNYHRLGGRPNLLYKS